MYLRRTPELNRIIAKRFRKRVRSKKAIVLIAEVDSTAVGFSTISIETNRGLLPRRFGYIGYLFVSRQYRGQRISSRMLKELLSWLGKRRIRHAGFQSWQITDMQGLSTKDGDSVNTAFYVETALR